MARWKKRLGPNVLIEWDSDKVEDQTRYEIDYVLSRGIGKIEGRIKSKLSSHMVTKNLIKSVASFRSRYNKKKDLRWIVGTWAPHAHLVEFGTKGLRYPTAKARKVKVGGGWWWHVPPEKGGPKVVWVTHTGQMPSIPAVSQSLREHRGKIESQIRALFK